MSKLEFNRRTVIAGSSALATASLLSRQTLAQGSATNRSAASLPPRREFVVRGAYVLSMDPAIGDLASGDVHVRDGAIVSVAAKINAPSVQVISGKDMICMPGFVETHWHLWTSLLRPVMRSSNPKRGYFPVTSGLGVHYTPEDSYRSVRLGLAQTLNAGITTVHNWAHNVRSPAHADGELSAMRDVGIRGRFSYGNPQGDPNDKPTDLDDIARVQRDWIAKDGLLTLGMCSRGVDNAFSGNRGSIGPDMAKLEWGGARKLGLPITLHTSGVGAIKTLNDAGLLGPDLQLVHPLTTSEEDRALLKKHGVSYSTSPIGEARRPARAGEIQLAELLEAGIKTSMSIDHTTTYNCDCFACMRMLYTLHSHRIGNKYPLTAKRLVQLATIDGAVDLGLADKVGSLSPGKRADLILVRTTDSNMAPVGDPYDALVSLAQPDNIEMVVVDGRILRQKDRYMALDYDKTLREAATSVAALMARAQWT